MSQGAQVEVVGIGALRGLAPGPLSFDAAEPRFDGGYHGLSHLVLQAEDVEEVTLKPLRPDLMCGLGLRQSAGHSDAPAGAAYRTLEHIAHAEFPPYLAQIHRLIFVGKGRV